MDALNELKKQSAQNLIIDLRGNPGGYLDAATALANEFLKGKKLIVYTQGKARPRKEYYSNGEGTFENGKLFILIDEGSASASEILSGALQDWDRAEIIGRRSFEKGLYRNKHFFLTGQQCG